jgi:hypothetical protein
VPRQQEPLPPREDERGDEDSEFAAESAVLLLFATKTNSAIGSEGKVHQLYNKLLKVWGQCYLGRKVESLRMMYNARVDSSTMRAQGKFEKYS